MKGRIFAALVFLLALAGLAHAQTQYGGPVPGLGLNQINYVSVNGQFNIQAYGAANYPIDSAGAIQAAINGACGLSSTGAAAAPVIFPPGGFALSYPFWANC